VRQLLSLPFLLPILRMACRVSRVMTRVRTMLTLLVAVVGTAIRTLPQETGEEVVLSTEWWGLDERGKGSGNDARESRSLGWGNGNTG
jgi:hypothetical protein